MHEERRPRLDAIDCVRGAAMVFMLLDHTRDFAHADAFLNDPLDPATTSPLLYATRWVTHLCAPTFVFLAGLGAGLQRLRGKPPRALGRLLWTRGLWLVLLELTVIRALIWFNVEPSLIAHPQVIWAIGIGMVVMAGLVRLPPAAVGTAGAAVILGHNLLDAVRAVPFRGPGQPLPSTGGKLWMLLHQGGFFPIDGVPGPMVLAQYPILPWLGVMMAGYGASLLYALPAERRRRRLFVLGGAMMGLFLVLRGINAYGDPRPWTHQATAVRTVLSFFNVAKYPPSASFLLVTLGVSLTALALLDGLELRGRLVRALVTFGRVPFFFYLLQWVSAHLAAIAITAALGKTVRECFLNLMQIILLGRPPDVGGRLRWVYVAWIAGTVLLYFPCRWFAALKERRREWWLSYL